MRNKKTRKTQLSNTIAESAPAPSIENRPPALVFWCQEPLEAKLIVTLLMAADAQCEVLATLEDVNNHLQCVADARVALIYRAPQTIISERMGEGDPPETSLKMCAQLLTDILRLVRSQRKRLMLFASQQVFQYPEAFLARVELSAANLPELVGFSASTNVVLDLIAAEALRQNIKTRSLAEELEACSIALDENGATEPPLQLAFTQYCQWQNQVQSAARNLEEVELLKTTLTESRGALAAQVDEVVNLRGRFAALSETNLELESQLGATASELKAHIFAVAERERRIAALEESVAATRRSAIEVDLLRTQLAEQLAEGESAREAVAERERRIAALEESLASALQDEGEVELLRAQLAEQLADSESAYESIVILNARLSALDNEKSNALEREAHLRSLVEKHAAATRQYENQIYQLSQGLESYEVQIGLLSAEKAELKASVQKVHDALLVAERTVQDQTVRLTGMKSDRRVADDQIAHLGRMVELYKIDLENTEAARSALVGTLAEMKACLDRVEQDYSRLSITQQESDAVNARLRSSKSELEQEVARLVTEKSQLFIKLNESLAELDAIKSAKFYRWLMPFRKLYGAMRRKVLKA
ncbi:MAG TPA: hypothetical protein VG897_16830 [Terriglobales bacterium]|nr:hypothetical protein [Terriglobales bacterium]